MAEDIVKKIRDILIAFESTPEEFENLCYMALLDDWEKIGPQVDFRGSRAVYVPKLIRILLRYGHLKSGEHALVSLLRELQKQVGDESQIEELIKEFEQSFEPPSPPPSIPPPEKWRQKIFRRIQPRFPRLTTKQIVRLICYGAVVVMFFLLWINFFDVFYLDTRFENLTMWAADVLSEKFFHISWLRDVFPNKTFSQQIVLIAISEQSENSLGQFNKSWRLKHADLIDKLSRIQIRLTEKVLASLCDENVPDHILEQLQPLIDEGFIDEQELFSALQKRIGEAQTKRYKETFVKYAVHGAKVITFDMHFPDATDFDRKFITSINNAKIRGTSVILGVQDFSNGRPVTSKELGSCFMLTQQSLDNLREERIPEEIWGEIAPLNDTVFATKNDFLSALGARLGREHMLKYQEQILEHVVVHESLGSVCIGQKFGYVRTLSLLIVKDTEDGQEEYFPSLALQTFLKFQGWEDYAVDLGAREVQWSSDHKLRFSEKREINQTINNCSVMQQGDSVADMFIEFSPLSTLRARKYAYEDILNGNIDLNRFLDKIVLVGRERGDSVKIPRGLQMEERYGFEIHADALNTLLEGERRGHTIQTLDPIWQLGVMVLLSFLAVFVRRVASQSRFLRMLLLGFIIVLYFGCTIVLYSRLHLLLNTLYQLGAFGLTYWVTGKIHWNAARKI